MSFLLFKKSSNLALYPIRACYFPRKKNNTLSWPFDKNLENINGFLLEPESEEYHLGEGKVMHLQLCSLNLRSNQEIPLRFSLLSSAAINCHVALSAFVLCSARPGFSGFCSLLQACRRLFTDSHTHLKSMARLLIAWRPWSLVWEESTYEPCHLLAAAETKKKRLSVEAELMCN